MPLTWVFYYNFTINTIYVIFIIIFLGWNTARNDIKRLERKLLKVDKENEGKDKKSD